MPYEIVNAQRSKSTITVVGNTATLITLSQLVKNPSASPATEIITSASIGAVASSTDGFWRIYRGNNTSGTLVLELEGSNYLPFTQTDIAIANGASSNIYVTNSGTGGTLILQVSKTANYTTDLDAA
jgi:glucose/arabinose dehydrogenase